MTEPIERHPTSTAYVVAGDRTLLLWHAKLGMWLPPGGHSEPNEDPVQTACREVLEESGLDVEVIAPPDLLVVTRPEVKPPPVVILIENIEREVIPPADLLVCEGPEVLPPPAVILVEDIVREDQPFHQHIDHVYFTRATGAVDFEAPIPQGPARWVDRETLAGAFSLPAPGGTLVPVAEDVRLLGVRALDAAAEADSRC